MFSVFTVFPSSAYAAEDEAEVVEANDESEKVSATKSQSEAVEWIKARGNEGWWEDVDGAYGCQCVDLIMKYYQYFGYSRVSGNAYEYQWNRTPPGSNWYYSSTPIPGSVFVKGIGSGFDNGHVGLVYAVDGSTIYTVETNLVSPYDGGRYYAKAQFRTRSVSFANTFINPDFIQDTSAPTISNARAENISANSFDIKCNLNDDVGVTRVWLNIYGPNGTTNGYELSASNGDFSHKIYTADYAGAGVYTVHIYAFDSAGNQTSAAVNSIYAGKRFSASNAVNLGDDFVAVISNVKSGKRVSVNGNDNVIIDSINNADIQKWHFIRYSDGSYKIVNCQTNKCLDVAGGKTENETNIQVYQSNESLAQKWYIIENTYGYGLVPLSCTSSAIDIAGGGTSDGANIHQYQWNQTAAQIFTIDYVSLTPNKTLEYNNHKYEFYNNNTTWYQAYRTCERMGGHLVTVTSDAEREKILEMTQDYSGRVWIGATIDGSKNWYWINSEPYVENSFWADGEPNNSGGNELVAEMDISGANKGQWNDISGYKSIVEGFVCEYDDIVDANEYEPIQSVTFGGYKYDLFDNSVDWQTAKKICELKGGQLTDISTETEQEVIGALAQKGSKSAYWIGLTDVENEGIWKWSKGTNASYKNWADKEPNNTLGIEGYVALNKGTGKWNDNPRYANEFSTMGFICKTKNTLIPQKTIEVNSHQYEFYSSTATWSQAVEICEQKGGHLVTITSEEENITILRLTEGYTGSAWIGATDFNNNLKWCWVNTEPFSYSNWNTNEPNNYLGKETCAEIVMSGTGAGKWNDMPMNSYSEKGFICEYDDIVNPDDYCPVSTVEKNGYRYELYEENVDWQTAKRICEKKQGFLVTIKDTDENNIVMSLAQKGSNAQYWIGLTDIDNEGQWKWCNEKTPEYTNWQLGEPNDDMSAEDYATIVKSDGKWNDIPGFTYYYKSVGFICKTPLHKIGDINLDGEITISDVTAIQRYITELDVFTDEQIALADTNGDGEINITDATHLQKYIAKFDGIVLGKQPA